MIEDIIITDLRDAESYAYNPTKRKYDVWITTLDEEHCNKAKRIRHLLSKKGINHFSQFFYDWSEEDSVIFKHLEKNAPTMKHMERIISFLLPYTRDEKKHNIGINCFAGISRSTAIGITALVMSGKTPKMALDYVLVIRPMAWPNLRMLRFASEILGKDLTSPVEDYKKSMDGKIII